MRKRIFSILLTIAVCLSMMPAGVWANEGNIPEKGTDNLFKINTVEEFKTFQNKVNRGGTADVNGHTHNTNTAWKAANSLPNSAGSYYLTQSVSGGWIVPEGEVNLCLNGKTIDGSIKVGSGATLTLTDCSGNGKVQGEVTVNGGKFELYSGTITGGVQVGINGGSYQTGSSFTMYGGAITGNEESSGSGGGVFLVGTTNQTDPPNFTMHGGTISNNTAGASDGGGGGVYVGEKCSFTMDGGTITGNTATAGNGGGIYIHFNAGNVSISNATITGNKASATGNTSYGHGGGIYSQRGVTVKNVTITGNNSTYEGGGIYGKGAITLTDATVTDNSQYDVYYDGKETTTPELTVSGSVKAGYYANFDWKLPILVSGELSENSVIHVGVREGIEHGAIAEPASGVTLRAENFKADAADCVTNLGEDGKVYLVPCTHEMDDTGYTCKKCHTQFDARVGDSAYYQTLTKAFDAARGSTVTLLRDVTLTGNCSSDTYSATLDLNGKTVSSDRYYICVGGGNKPNTLTVKDSGTGGGTQALTVKFLVYSNGTLAVDNSYTGKISRVELQAGGALERFGGEIGELVLSNAAHGSTSTGYGLKLWKGNTNACTIGGFTDNTTSKSLTVNDLLGTAYAKCELYGEKDGTWSIVDKSTKIAELTGYTAYKVQFPECVHQCADDSNPVCSVCHKKLYTKITAKAADGTTKTAYFTEDSALENGYVEAIQTLNGWSNEGCTEPTLTLLRDMYAYGTSMPLTGTLTLKGGTHTAKNVTVAKNADVTFASGSYKGATIDGTATVKEGVTFTDASVEVNGTLNAKGGTFTGNVKFNGSSIANISGGSFNNEKKYGGVTFDYNVTGTITGGTFTFADFYTTKVKLSGGTFTMIKTNGDRKLADLLAEGAAYYGASDNQAVTNDSVNTLENVKVVSHTHNGGADSKGICSICGKQMTASLTVGGKTSWYVAFATAIEAANAADGEKAITLYQNVDDTVHGKRTAYELTRGPVTLATGGKRVDGVDLIAKGISLTVTGSNGSFYVTVDGKDAELTVDDGNTELAIVTAQNGGKLSLSNGTFSRVAVKDDGSSASLSGGSYGEITSDTGYVKPYALLAKGYAYKKTTDNKWLPNANSIPSKVTVEKAPFAVEKIYPNSDTNYTGNSAFATDGNITLTAVIAPETEGVTYYYWWELFNESINDWTTTFSNVNTATHDGKQSKTLSISDLPENSIYQYHVYVSSDNGYNCYSEPFTVSSQIVPVVDKISTTEITYGQQLSESKISGTMKDGNKEVDGTFSWKDGNVKPDAGIKSYDWVFKPKDTVTYAEATGSVDIKVNPKNVTEDMISNIDDVNYNGNQQKPAVVIKDGDKSLTVDTDYILSYGENINAGKGTVNITGKGNYTGTASKDFTINKINQTAINFSGSKTTTYGTDLQLAVTGGNTNGNVTYGIISDNESTGTATIVGSKLHPTKAGTIKVKATMAGNTNCNAVSVTDIFTINKAAIDLSNVKWTETSSFKYDGNVHKVELTGLPNIVTVSYENNEKIYAGSYSARATLNYDKDNYELSGTISDYQWSITVAEDPAVIAAAAIVTKGGNTVDLSNNVTGAKGDITYRITSGLDGCSIDNNGVFTSGDTAGECIVTVNVAAKDIDGDGTPEYSGKTGTIIVTVSDKADAGVTLTGDIPTEKTYGDADFELKAQAADAGTGNGSWKWTSGNSDVLQVTGSGATATVKILKSGTVTITAEYESGTTLGSKTVTIKVVKRLINIKANNKNITVNDTLPTFDVTYDGFVYGDTAETVFEIQPTVSTAADGKTAGTFEITVTAPTIKGEMADKYDVGTLEKGTLTVKAASSVGGGGGIVIPVQKPEITTGDGGKTDLSDDGTTIKITPDEGKEVDKVLVNGKDIGAVTEVKDLKPGDKVEVIFKDKIKEPTKEELDSKVKEALNDMTLKARSAKTSKKNIRINVIASITDKLPDGYTVKYKYYRSTKKTSGYRLMTAKSKNYYINTKGTKGTRYYYKARVAVYDNDGKLIAQTELKQCKYAARVWTKLSKSK